MVDVFFSCHALYSGIPFSLNICRRVYNSCDLRDWTCSSLYNEEKSKIVGRRNAVAINCRAAVCANGEEEGRDRTYEVEYV